MIPRPMIGSSGSFSPTHFLLRKRFWKRFWQTIFAAAFLSITLYATGAFGSCNIIPETDSLNARRNEICAALSQPTNCFLKPRKLVAVEMYITETNFSLEINGEFVGLFPIPSPIPIDPSTVTKDLVTNLLRYHTGSPEIQQILRQKFHLSRREIVYFDNIIDFNQVPYGTSSLNAEAMVVRK